MAFDTSLTEEVDSLSATTKAKRKKRDTHQAYFLSSRRT